MFPMMLDLFDTPVIPGLRSAAGFLTPGEEGELVTEIDRYELIPFRFQQWTGKRLTHSFGWSYDFERGQNHRAEPIPSWLLPLRERAARFAGFPPGDIIQALLIRYDPGAGIGWHKDRPVYEHVIGLSLGAFATMRLRRHDGDRWLRHNLPLEPRGLYQLSGEVRHEWEHSIGAMDERRYSITFRTLSKRGKATGLMN